MSAAASESYNHPRVACVAVQQHKNAAQRQPISEKKTKQMNTLSQTGKKSSLIFVAVHCKIVADLCAEIGFEFVM